MTSELVTWLNERRQDSELRDWAGDLLWALCKEDTSLGDDLERLRRNEQRCFELLHDAMREDLSAGAEQAGLPVPGEIAEDPYFTQPYYAGELAGDVEAVYRGRHNWWLDPQPGKPGDYWLLNAHVDTVPPHIPPSRPSPERMNGRGTADDKNGLVAMALVQKLLHQWHQQHGERPAWPVRYLVSIDEEMGGNGTLGAVRQLDLAQAHIVVAEPSSLLPYPANRGAVWFAARLATGHPALQQRRYGVFAFVAQALMAAGQALREESEHPMFNAHKDAQTCFGMLGPFGLHPSSACDEVTLRWALPGSGAETEDLERAEQVIQSTMASAILEGCLSHDTRDPEIQLVEVQGRCFIEATISAIGGHMGSHERDSDALAKASGIILAMMDAGWGEPEWPQGYDEIVLEGGQGFLPDRSLADLQQRMRSAFKDGVARAALHYGVDESAIDGDITFDKLHNAAFCSAEDAPGGHRLRSALASLNGGEAPGLKGWKASCDARIFARHCPDVTTFGPGALEVAHSNREGIELQDILDMAATVVHAVLQDREGTR